MWCFVNTRTKLLKFLVSKNSRIGAKEINERKMQMNRPAEDKQQKGTKGFQFKTIKTYTEPLVK